VGVVICIVALAAGGGWLVRRRAARGEPAQVASAPASASSDPTWCGKPLGAGAIGQLKDRASCTKISLTGTAPSCLFWADCGELHFEIDCGEKWGAGQCRCDGEEGRTVPYDPAFCALDRTNPAAGLRAVLDSAATACRWAPRPRP
jgi:hypothetical protein